MPDLTCVSTFSGAGGSSTGYEAAGFTVLWANEFVPAAAQTYAANHPNAILDTRDIRTVTAADVLDATGLDVGELDLLDGSPPCAAFSTGGKRSEKWGQVNKYSDTAQRVDDLFFEYVRLLRGIQPKTFIAENVPGLTMGPAVGYFNAIMAALSGCGYQVKAQVLDASRLGVPQARRRVIFAGVRDDLGCQPVYPRQGPMTPLGVVLGPHARISIYRPRGWVHYTANRPCPTIQSTGLNGRAYAQTCLTGVIALDLDPEIGCPLAVTSKDVNSIWPGRYRRLPSIVEVKALCGFPSDYILTGSYGQRWERLGRAVPPPVAAAVAASLRDGVLCAV